MKAILALLLLSAAGCAPPGNRVEVRASSQGHELFVNGKPFYVQGAGVGEAFGRKGENYLALAREMGANTVRTWGTDQGTKKYLDEARRQGLLVAAGIWIKPAAGKEPVTYLQDSAYLRDKERETLDYVRRFKRHPAVLAWNIGNECLFFTKDPREREALARFLETLIRKVKKEDPDHPVLYASVNSLDLPVLKKHVPSLDIIGMNIYGSVIGAQSGWAGLGFSKPYVVTEFGPLGPWDLPRDALEKTRELDDFSKAVQYRNHWSLIRERRGKNVGGFVFHVGETTQESLTMWNVNDGLYKKEPFVMMQKLFGAAKTEDHAPRIRSFEGVPLAAAPGQPFEVRVDAYDPEGAELTYVYRASTAKQDILEYYVNEEVPLHVEGEGPRVTLTSPRVPGVYRLYCFVRDKTRHTGAANRTLEVA